MFATIIREEPPVYHNLRCRAKTAVGKRWPAYVKERRKPDIRNTRITKLQHSALPWKKSHRFTEFNWPNAGGNFSSRRSIIAGAQPATVFPWRTSFPRADNVAPRLIGFVPIHAATTFNGFLARGGRRRKTSSLARLDRETGRSQNGCKQS